MGSQLSPSVPDLTPLSFGDLIFNETTGIPASINIGELEEDIVETKIPGGGKVTMFMGLYPNDVKWSGTIIGPSAQSVIQKAQAYQLDGKERLLSWWIHLYYGRLKSFVPTGKNANRVDYEATVVITRGAGGTLKSNGQSTASQQYTSLLQTAVPAASAIGAADYSAAAQNIVSGTNALGSLSSVTTAVQKLQQVTALLAQAQAYSATLSQIDPSFVATQRLISSLTAMTSVLTIVGTQSMASLSGPMSIYALAGQVYGDVTQAYPIMAANGLISPRVAAGVTLALKLPIAAKAPS